MCRCPVAVDEHGGVQLLNLAARRLFDGAVRRASPTFPAMARPSPPGMENLKPGDGAIVRMERTSGALQLKAAATDVALGGMRRRLISLQNIETELTAHELAAWQTVIRVMAHEVMNSLTPISSLAATAARPGRAMCWRNCRPDDPNRAALADAGEALETLARRSEGLLHFVQNHRRLTKRMVAQLRDRAGASASSRGCSACWPTNWQARDIALAIAGRAARHWRSPPIPTCWTRR